MSDRKVLINNEMLPFKYDSQSGGVKLDKTLGISKQDRYALGCAGGLHIINNVDSRNSVKGGYIKELLFPNGLTAAAAALGLFAASRGTSDYVKWKKK